MDVRKWVAGFAELVAADADRLTRLDAAIGDGDHGTNLARGMAAATAAPVEGPPGKVLIAAGRALLSKTGGASGPLYGGALRGAGKALGDTEDVTAAELGTALRAALEAIQSLGAAVPGDKTMVDALDPAVTAYETALAAGGDLGACCAAALEGAEKGAEATVALQARKGRASYLGARSVGHEDPGAASTVLLFRALKEAA
jgi:dihydroxyacetone kinase phosphoprotein-dependent L subunit